MLGFANRWYPIALETARSYALPSGAVIRLISAPAFLATKFEAFADRGNGDVPGSHDLEDLIGVIANREGILDEIRNSPAELRTGLAQRCSELLALPDFDNYLPGLVLDGAGTQADLVRARLREIAAGSND